MTINLTNSKAYSGETTFSFFNMSKEWEAYKKEFPKLNSKLLYSPEDRFKGGKAVDVFAKAIEYIPRSLIPRPYQYWLARHLINLLHSEKKYRVLDYGAGAGNMGMIFSITGFKTDFADVKGEIVNFLRWRVERHFLNSKVFTHEEDLGENQYDLICMQNVMEHLDEPLIVLQKLNKAMIKGAYFLITFNTKEQGLDVVTWNTYKNQLEPYINSNFNIVPNTDKMLYQKI